MNVFDRMELLRPGFTAAEERIYQRMKEAPTLFIGGVTINDYARICDVSKSAISRFSVKLGYQAFAQMRYDIANSILSNSNEKSIDPYDHIIFLYKEALDLMASETLRKDASEVAKLIAKKRRVKIFGVEASGYLGEIFASRLIKTGIDANCYIGKYLLKTPALYSSSQMVCFFISVRMEDEDIRKAIEVAHESGSKVIVMTSNPNCGLTNCIDHLLLMPSTRGAGKSFYLPEHPAYLVFLEALTEKVSELNLM